MGRKKKEIRLKEPVRIREKKIAGGNISLYLDIYQKGLRKKERDVETLSCARNQRCYQVAKRQYKKVGRANQGAAHS